MRISEGVKWLISQADYNGPKQQWVLNTGSPSKSMMSVSANWDNEKMKCFQQRQYSPQKEDLSFLWLHVDIHVHWGASNFMGEKQLGASFPVFLVFRDVAFWYHRHSSHTLKRKYGLYKRFVRKTNNSKHTFDFVCIFNTEIATRLVVF